MKRLRPLLFSLLVCCVVYRSALGNRNPNFTVASHGVWSRKSWEVKSDWLAQKQANLEEEGQHARGQPQQSHMSHHWGGRPVWLAKGNRWQGAPRNLPDRKLEFCIRISWPNPSELQGRTSASKGGPGQPTTARFYIARWERTSAASSPSTRFQWWETNLTQWEFWTHSSQSSFQAAKHANKTTDESPPTTTKKTEDSLSWPLGLRRSTGVRFPAPHASLRWSMPVPNCIQRVNTNGRNRTTGDLRPKRRWACSGRSTRSTNLRRVGDQLARCHLSDRRQARLCAPHRNASWQGKVNG